MRLRSYTIECDGCYKVESSSGSWEAEFNAKKHGWLLRAKRGGKTVDLCRKCRAGEGTGQ